MGLPRDFIGSPRGLEGIPTPRLRSLGGAETGSSAERGKPGASKKDGHLYQTLNLDWHLEAGAHHFPALVVCLPVDGHARGRPDFEEKTADTNHNELPDFLDPAPPVSGQ
ncbi:MAG: hypothetical protein ACKV19_02950 [Verrucomicrobiales bacterium]